MIKIINKLNPILVDEEQYFYSLSFDIDDFIGDGIWWLQIYNSDKQMINDKPFAGSQWEPDDEDVYGTVFALLFPWKYATHQGRTKRGD